MAFLNFISGTITAVVIGVQAAGARTVRLNAIDIGLVTFVAISAAQNFAGTDEASTAAEVHATLLVAWGGSNYVGAVLVIVGYWLLARAMEIERGRWVLLLAIVASFVTAVSTLSRGTIVALSVGLLVATWNSGGSRFTRVVSRLGVLVVPVVGLWLMNIVVGERFENTSADPAYNIDARWGLYRLAWDEFLRSPLFGTGWTGLREVSPALLGSPITFAHNWYFSALQIAGLFALPMLIVFTWLTLRGVIGAGVYGAPVAAAFTAAMIEPVMEGYVGALVIVSVLVISSRVRDDRQAEKSVAVRLSSSPT
ncbi:hypothetical protein SRABI121_02960 [Microbacterium sp. Bi121]|nr:hypothetical protein SRABI121_02960 [Microbacterium sp. Bi121]